GKFDAEWYLLLNCLRHIWIVWYKSKRRNRKVKETFCNQADLICGMPALFIIGHAIDDKPKLHMIIHAVNHLNNCISVGDRSRLGRCNNNSFICGYDKFERFL